MRSAVMNVERGMSNVVLLAFLGGGAFGNEDAWIHGAIRRSLAMFASFDLAVKIVSYHAPSPEILRLVRDFQ